MPRKTRITHASSTASMQRVGGLWWIFLLFMTINGSAWAEVSVEPTRIVLDQDHRTAQITIRNDGLRALKVTPVWTHLIQAKDAVLHPNGQEVTLADMPMLRLWPTQTNIAPRSSVVFSLLLPPETKIATEKRVHLRFNFDPQHGQGPRWAVVLPVFVRGNLNLPDVEITYLHLQEDADLSVTMRNTSATSSYGHLVVFDRDGQRLATLNNVNLFTTGLAVTFNLQLPEIPIKSLKVRYIGDAEFSGTAFAEKEMQLNVGSSQ